MYRRLLRCGACSCRIFHHMQKGALKVPSCKPPMSFMIWGIALRKYCINGHGDLLKNQPVQQYLQSLTKEYRHITQKLQNGQCNEYERKALNKRQVELLPIETAFQNMESAMNDLKELEAILQSSVEEKDRHMLELLKDEHAEMSKRLQALKAELIQTMIPCDRLDSSSDVILEVVSGRTTGGDICQQFTEEVFDMYSRFSSYKNWDFEVYNYTPADYGGLHHAAARVSGENAYKFLKYEGGTHRVQRIPQVGLSSRMQRIHTGTTTVIVLPQPSKIDLDIDPKELQVDTFRSSGAGGQSVNTTDSAVRIVHVPTGIKVECQESRSQLQNRDTAMRLLRAKIYQWITDQEQEKSDATRKHQIGTRSQSERIRTYNFTQDRVTDHRIGHVTRDIKGFLRGGEILDQLITELMHHAERTALLELAQNTNSE
ncbi:peptide chain release factor 1, mitochondrial isoform X1 [Paramormyrops kingsleyae]|uniref:Mitochondrial translation release factor 1 n=2 Tax=Paramormyrops kingsleyae TaxID=1676925 RepID=A0A3B3T3C6_9TELE|nr:peptide chain release factor 1, mitochondrial isoform X1 [Paramormyrops kingsleyae]